MCQGCIFHKPIVCCELSNSDINKWNPQYCPHFHAYAGQQIDIERKLNAL